MKTSYKYLALLSLLAACRLTSTDVEPDLPSGRPDGSNILVAYRVGGRPVVANNAADFGTFIGALFGARQPVSARLAPDSTLSIRALDSNNQPDGYPQHDLTLVIRRFRGPGTYALDLPPGRYGTGNTVYEEYLGSTRQGAQYPVAGARNQLLVSAWSSATGTLQGTFELRVAGTRNPQSPADLTDGRFDVDVQR